MSVNRSAAALIDAPRGLAGVVVTDTRIGDVRGVEGFYHYRQYSAVDLARTRTFEDVWHLLVHGELPDARQSAVFAAETAALRRLPDEVRAALPVIAAAGGRSGPLAGMRTALSLLGAAKGFRPVYDIEADRRRQDTLEAAAAVPALLTALHRLGKGRAGGAARGPVVRSQLPRPAPGRPLSCSATPSDPCTQRVVREPPRRHGAGGARGQGDPRRDHGAQPSRSPTRAPHPTSARECC
ncbi:hypothetical protein SVIOM74S_08911 [Streptomyces violarus]